MSQAVAFVNDPEFLRSAFDFGLTVDDGVRELVDNALDAGATEIIIIIQTTQDALHLIVEDNGVGIPDTLEEEGSTYQGIPYVMSFGGAKNFMKRSKGEIGKFGIGLSATITCLTREFGRATVWSQNAGNAQGRCVTYRFDDVVANDCMLPPEETKPRPKFTDATTGTVVELVLEDSAHMRPGAMQTRFLKFLGRNYRNSIHRGVSITVVSMSAKGQPSSKKVHLRDPLALMEGSEEVEKLGMAKAYDVPPLVMNDIIDPETGEPAVINFRLSLMNPITVRRKLGLNLTDTDVEAMKKDGETKLKRYGIGHDGQGFNLLREGREIAANASLNIYNKHPMFNNMHGDIDFPAVMDGYFGVQSNKSRTSMNVKIRDALKKHLDPFIWQIRTDSISQQKQGAQLAKKIPDEPLAESLAKLLKPVLPQPRLTPEQIEKAKAMREEMVQKLTNAAYTHNKAKKRELEQKAAATNDRGEKEQLELESEMLNERLQHHINRIEARFAVSSPTRLFYESMHNNDLYKMEDRGDEAHITVNKDTVFYTDVYSQIENVPHMRVLLDMMINSLGYAEFLAIKHGDDMKELYWQRARAEVSFHANTFVKAMPPKPERNGGEA